MKRSLQFDRDLGQRVRLAGLANGMSQSTLGDAVGITFQQIQKYEKGSNRISAGRLSQVATILNVDINYFFDGASPQNTSQTNTSTGLLDLTKVDMEILRPLSDIKDTQLTRLKL